MDNINIYVTEGSELGDLKDWQNNKDQFFGNSNQYEISVSNAEILHELVGNKKLYFTGHSLGGGMASANALATGRHAYTYNAAGLSNATRDKYDAGFSSSINATIVRGEFVDVYQRKYLDVYAEGDITYIDHESKAYVEFFNTFSPVIGTYNQIRLHFIESIINFLDCE